MNPKTTLILLFLTSLLSISALAIADGANETISGSPLGSRENPLPIGTMWDMGDGWHFAVLDVIPDATQIVLEKSMFDAPPSPGNQFFLAKIRICYDGENSEFGILNGGSNFWAVGASNVAYNYENRCVVIPDPLPFTEIFRGGCAEGYVSWNVKSDDIDSLVLYHHDYSSLPRVYFSLVENQNKSDEDEAIQIPEAAFPVEAVSHQKTTAEWFDEGLTLYNQGKYDEAIQAFDEVIRLDPKRPTPWNNKGNALYKQGKYTEAIQAYDVAISLDPEYSNPWNNKGGALDSLGKYEEAIQAYDEAIRLDSEYADAWSNKGNALYKQGKYTEAIQAYDEALKLDPGHIRARSNKDLAIRQLDESDSVEAVATTRGISDDNAMDAIKKLLEDEGFSDVATRIGDGRAKGGVKTLILSYRSNALDTEYFGMETSTILGSFLGTVEAGWDCDELWVVVGDRFGTATGMWYCLKEWKEAYVHDRMTAEEVLLSVLGTMETL
jgi:tetratricopeptide (TPR) repeat protein